MKTLLPVMAFLVLSFVRVSAQDLSDIAARSQPATAAPATAHDVTGFTAPTYAPGPGVSSRSLQTPPKLHPNLKPKLGGIFIDGAKYGAIMVSPTAPAEYGIGEKYLSAPSQSYDLQHESGQAAHRDAGGFKLFSLEF